MAKFVNQRKYRCRVDIPLQSYADRVRYLVGRQTQWTEATKIVAKDKELDPDSTGQFKTISEKQLHKFCKKQDPPIELGALVYVDDGGTTTVRVGQPGLRQDFTRIITQVEKSFHQLSASIPGTSASKRKARLSAVLEHSHEVKRPKAVDLEHKIEATPTGPPESLLPTPEFDDDGFGTPLEQFIHPNMLAQPLEGHVNSTRHWCDTLLGDVEPSDFHDAYDINWPAIHSNLSLPQEFYTIPIDIPPLHYPAEGSITSRETSPPPTTLESEFSTNGEGFSMFPTLEIPIDNECNRVLPPSPGNVRHSLSPTAELPALWGRASNKSNDTSPTASPETRTRASARWSRFSTRLSIRSRGNRSSVSNEENRDGPHEPDSKRTSTVVALEVVPNE